MICLFNIKYYKHINLHVKRFLSLTKAVSDTDQQHAKLKISPEDKIRMKQKRKEAKRQERIVNQQFKLAKKQVAPANNIKIIIPTETFPEKYDPKFVESKWYEFWMRLGIFNADSPIYKDWSSNPRFSMCLPPPNITGSLHIGHALGCSIQDAICRWHRMNGKLVTWIPGCDHAGIATQVVVEKHLLKMTGNTRHSIGREAFVEEVLKWKELHGDQILNQMKRMGCSLDWSRLSFTLDEKLSTAVDEAFIRLFEKGLIYRSKRLVNWSCALKSAISDIEVDNVSIEGPTLIKVPNYEEKVLFGTLTTFAYPILGSAEEIQVSTTRLETMLGDVGVAVHPSDGRYQHLIGRSIVHPLTSRHLTIVADDKVDPTFGTGAVKLTPGHDLVDFEIASRNNLNVVNILNDEGLLVNVPQQFLHLPRYTARKSIEQQLKALNLFRGVQEHNMNLPICNRSGDIVEYVVKDQWFVKCQDMARKAIEAVEYGGIEFVPSHYNKQWTDWLNNIRDWCISRQLWWGHRIPAYKIIKKNEPTNENEGWIAAANQSEAWDKLVKSGRDSSTHDLLRDDDVLDTWFSSSLVPFSNFGWPKETLDLTQLFPTDLLETASDIMFFWVARMVMMSEELTGKLPFKRVIFHSIVQDARGRKMSKSVGNVVDPMHIINGVSLEKHQSNLRESNLNDEEIERASSIFKRDFPLGIPECGADALRFALLSNNYLGHYINIDVNHIKSCQTFCNKIWQSFKYFSSKLRDHKLLKNVEISDLKYPLHPLSTLDDWILSRLSDVVQTSDDCFSNVQMYDAVKLLQQFWWMDFCNVYLECTKPVFKSSVDSSTNINNVVTIMLTCFDTFLKLLHPFMPFITEHLYQELADVMSSKSNKFSCNLQMPFSETISLAIYPKVEDFPHRDRLLEKEMDEMLNVISKLNSTKTLLNIHKSHNTPVMITRHTDTDTYRPMDRFLPMFKCLSRCSDVFIRDWHSINVSECIHICEIDGQDVYMKVKGSIDVEQHLQQLISTNEKYKVEKVNLMNGQAFLDIAHDQHLMISEKVTGLTTTIERLENMIESLRKLNT